jgi:hypothetical protein
MILTAFCSDKGCGKNRMAEKAARQFISSLLCFDRLANRLFDYILIPCFGCLSVLPPTIPMRITIQNPNPLMYIRQKQCA